MASSDHRRYRLKARAERQRQTRDRIVDATVELHREVGPARTTIADIARRAGVQRLTVYNHFPELLDLLAACQGHFLAGNPPPDIAPGESGQQPLSRLEEALTALYGWYRSNQMMDRHVDRDRHLIAELDDLMRRNVDPRFDSAAAQYTELIAPKTAATAQVQALIRVGLEFRTWDVLASQGIADGQIARLFRIAVGAVAEQP